MADRYPLVVDSSNFRIEELPAGDSLDFSGASIKSASITGPCTVTGSTSDFESPLLRITQTGNGHALLVEDDTHPDTTPGLVISGVGSCGIGTTIPSARFDVRLQSNAGFAYTTNPVGQNVNDRITAAIFGNLGTLGNDNNIETQIGIAAGRTGQAVYTLGVKKTDGNIGNFNMRRSIGSGSTDFMTVVGTATSAQIGIGTTQPKGVIDIFCNPGDTAITLSGSGLENDRFGQIKFDSQAMTLIAPSDGDNIRLIAQNNVGRVELWTAETQVSAAASVRVAISTVGIVTFFQTYNYTTASAANMVIESNGEIKRSTSSARYKTNINNVTDEESKSVLSFRPVTYQSKDNADDLDATWFGLIAEEVAEIEPRLVSYGYSEDAWDLIDGRKVLKEGAEKVPQGVMYDKIVVLLIDRIKKLEARLESAGL